MRVLLTGVTGFIGSYVVAELISAMVGIRGAQTLLSHSRIAAGAEW
jgi:thioester reductase-like protein